MVQPGPPREDRPVTRKRAHRPHRLRWVALIMLLAGAAVTWHYYFNPYRSRTMRVRVFTDFGFRQNPGWQTRVRLRMEEVSRIYRDAAEIRWQIVSMDATDPGSAITSLEQRRRNLADAVHGQEDLALSLTAIPGAGPRASVMPFSHAAVVADVKGESEEEATLRLAHELGHLFGVEHEKGTLMAEPPANARFSPRAVKLLRTLKRYDFAAGVNALQSFWGLRAASALIEEGSGLVPMPESHAYRVLALSLTADGQLPAAAEQFRKALQADPKNTDTRIELAGALVLDSHSQEAVTVLREGVDAQPRNVDLRSGLASVLNRVGHPIRALEEINQALRQEPDRAELHMVRGSVLVSEPGFIDQAIAEFETAAKLNPSLDVARERLEAARLTKETVLAEAEPYREHVRQNPKDAEGHYNLGVLQLRAGKLDEARGSFERAAALDPREGPAHINLAVICFARKDYSGAAQELAKAKAAGAEPSAELADAVQRKVAP